MVSAVLDWIYPRRCGLCGLIGTESLCAACAGEFAPAPDGPPPGASVDEARAVWVYVGRAAQAVRRLKFDRVTPLAAVMAGAMHELAGRFEFDFVVPVPIHWSRRFWRGFNQSELLCERLSGDLVRPGALRRIRATRPQAGLNRQARLANLVGAFRSGPEAAGARVLLLDDVVTSGGTANECARALKLAGARWVGLATFASAALPGTEPG